MCEVEAMIGKPKIKRYKIVNKFKFIRFITMVLLAGFIFILLVQNRNQAYSSVYKEQYMEVQVEKGDTLWEIAKEFMPENYDVRKMVYEIRQLNDMNSGNIYPKEIIKVPIK